MADPHDKFAATAQRLIAKHGRDMVVRKISRTPANSDEPWNGPSTDPEEGYEFQVPVVGVVTKYAQEEIDGESIRASDRRVLVAAKPHPDSDLLTADSVLDEEALLSIITVSVLKPGTTRILYDIQVR